MKWHAWSVVLLVIGMWSASAAAHLLPAKRGTINVVGENAFVVLSISVSALADVGADDDHDGLLSARELTSHGAVLRREIDRRLMVADGEQMGETRALDLVLSVAHDTQAPSDRAAQIVALKHVAWDHAPTDLRVTCDLFGEASAERQLTVTATRHKGQDDQETEAGIYTPEVTIHRYFRPITHALVDYLRLGAAHVLLGTDHLLFLLTAVVAGFGFRYWLRIVTGFTLAHSLTLGAAMLGYVHLSARIVEPLIALSIVLVAFDNLRAGSSRPPGQRMVLVSACGLLHGLGFASSMDAMGLDGHHRVASLVGFNLGVEAGQGAFLLAIFAILSLGRSLFPRVDPLRLARLVSILAIVVGTLWLVQRMQA